MLRTFIQCFAFLNAIISAVFLIKGVISTSVKHMVELSQTRWNYSSAVLKSLTQQRADTIVGFSLLLLSFVLQLLHWLLPYGIGDLGIDRRGVIIAIVASIPIFIVAYGVSCFLRQKWFKQAENILKESTDQQKQ